MSFYLALQSFYTILFVLLICLYFLKTKLPYSYRIITGLQGLSLLIFSKQLYLSFENEFGLRMLARSNGAYNLSSSRLEDLSFDHAVGTYAVMGCFVLAYLFGYDLVQTFRSRSAGYLEYLEDGFLYCMNGGYFFTSKLMFFFIGYWINTNSNTIGAIISFFVFSSIIGVVLIKLFYDFHQNKLERD